jgi:ketoreductase
MTLEGKVALVTGGNTGIGKAIALKLAQEGAKVTICSRSEQTLLSAVEEMEDQGFEILHFACDVGEANQVEEVVSQVVSRFGGVEILVNNAGALEHTPIERPDDEAWSRILKTNLDGPYLVTSRAVSHMPDGGRIINVSSVLGKFGVARNAGYCAAKHGLIGFTRAVALELAPRKITVNAICPGWAETDLARFVMERAADQEGVSYEEFRRQALNRVPLGEMIRPDEIAALVFFLVTPAARNITGQAYNICGGQVMY